MGPGCRIDTLLKIRTGAAQPLWAQALFEDCPVRRLRSPPFYEQNRKPSRATASPSPGASSPFRACHFCVRLLRTLVLLRGQSFMFWAVSSLVGPRTGGAGAAGASPPGIPTGMARPRSAAPAGAYDAATSRAGVFPRGVGPTRHVAAGAASSRGRALRRPLQLGACLATGAKCNRRLAAARGAARPLSGRVRARACACVASIECSGA